MSAPERIDEREPELPPWPVPPGRSAVAPTVLVAVIVALIAGLSLWYAVQPQPLLVQGEADARRIDIAARVDGRVGARPVERG